MTRAESGKTVHAMFETQAENAPESTAAIDRSRRYSYGLLNERANKWAHYLQRLGVGPEVVVAVCVERSMETIVGVLAVLKTGGAYVPLDPDYPAERLKYMLDDTRARVLLTQERLLDCLPAFEGERLCLDRDWPLVADEPGFNVVSDVRPSNLVYVIYTSGSTGRPKGVMIEHRSLLNYVTWFNCQFGISSDDRVLASSSPSFDAFGIELYPALLAGGTMVITQAGALNPAALLQAAVAERITMLALVPTTLRLLVEQPALGACAEVRQVVCGGEQLWGDLAARFAERLPVPLHNLYGPTEATIDASFYTCLPGARINGPVPIGRAIANTRLHVLTDRLEPVPVGLPGQLYVGGAAVGRGYLGRPADTAKSFVPDPFARGGSCLYRTGDLVRWRADGNLEFLGRVDQQVKLRGHRVELGEVEAAMSRHPGVQDCVVGVEEVNGAQQLTAYFVPTPRTMPTEDELWRFLRDTLPPHMLPARFATLKRLPVTPNGKVDRRALPSAHR